MFRPVFWGMALLATVLPGCKNHYHVGYFSKDEWIAGCQWKQPVATRWKPDARYVDSLKSLRVPPADVVVFTGSWCNDSRKWVPRFWALQPMLPLGRVQVVGLDTTKHDEAGLWKRYAIDSIPTLVFEREGREIGRMEVKPVKRNLARHLYLVLKRP